MYEPSSEHNIILIREYEVDRKFLPQSIEILTEADALAKEGVSHLIVAARRLKKLQSIAGKFTSTYDKLKVKAVKVDVLSREDRDNLQSEVANFFPKDCVLILINNAGVEHFHRFETISLC